MELPHPVVQLLSFIGITWPEIDEDKVRELAGHVRDFADKVDNSHQDATATLKNLSEGYQGASYEAMISTWATMSDTHMSELHTACHAVATALDMAATAITGLKVAAIGELVGLAVTFVADQAAAVFTFGLSEAALPAIEAAASGIMKKLVKDLEDQIVGQVVEAAISPLEDTVAKAVSGLVYKEVAAALGEASSGSVGTAFSIDPDVVRTASSTMRSHAEDVAGHADELSARVSEMSFE
ncbi:WXG100 family type VII secretion target [Kitasatospora sp. GAS204B]|uniref:WXG100-like domain-containing protein n=1 Tax=unclassified Kitasatospora TaxID=2633591 RepID=UPI0024753265|nr:WXG100 family type VII secretion target [Kitasatospora sp. GAS204B]